jgi:predicted DNA-binding protein (MmcQ/YjbR family)
MNIDAIRKYCLNLPQATEKLQWDDALCFKIRGKMFAVAGLDNPRLTFKCTPEKFAELIERENIHPSPYLGRYKWVMLDRLDALPEAEMKALMRESYDMIEAGAPRGAPRKKKTAKQKQRPTRKKSRSRRRTAP